MAGRVGGTPEGAFTVLLVCTGNICRSALAERLGTAYLEDVLGERAAAIRIVSAGTHAVVDSEMDPHTAEALRRLGGAPAGFRARQFTADMAAAADLTLTMTREHRRGVLEQAPRALARTFTLLEAADLVGRAGDDREVAGTGFAERARSLVQRMHAARRGRRAGGDDDVPDPIGLPAEVHQRMAETVAAPMLRILGRLADLEHRRDEHPGDPPEERR